MQSAPPVTVDQIRTNLVAILNSHGVRAMAPDMETIGNDPLAPEYVEVIFEMCLEDRTTGIRPIDLATGHLTDGEGEFIFKTASFELRLEKSEYPNLLRGGEVMLYWLQLRELVVHERWIVKAAEQDNAD